MSEAIISKITNILFDTDSVTVQTQSSSTGSLLRKTWCAQKRELVSSQLQTHFQPQRQLLIFSYHRRFCSEQTGVSYRPKQKGYRGQGSLFPFCSFPGCPVDILLLCGHNNRTLSLLISPSEVCTCPRLFHLSLQKTRDGRDSRNFFFLWKGIFSATFACSLV